MSAVSEIIVREFFELHGFFVRQQRKYVTPSKREEEEIDFLVENPRPAPRDTPLPGVLEPADLNGLARALIAVRGGHTETFYARMLQNSPEFFRFLKPPALQPAARAFPAGAPLTKLLVVSALPAVSRAREETVQLLRSKGIDAVIPFRTILADLIARVEANRNYEKSDVLQILRILKNHQFFKEPQLELFKPKRGRPKRTPSAAAPRADAD